MRRENNGKLEREKQKTSENQPFCFHNICGSIEFSNGALNLPLIQYFNSHTFAHLVSFSGKPKYFNSTKYLLILFLLVQIPIQFQSNLFYFHNSCVWTVERKSHYHQALDSSWTNKEIWEHLPLNLINNVCWMCESKFRISKQINLMLFMSVRSIRKFQTSHEISLDKN